MKTKLSRRSFMTALSGVGGVAFSRDIMPFTNILNALHTELSCIKRERKLLATTDYFDNVDNRCNCFFEKKHLDELHKYLSSIGVSRHQWIYNPLESIYENYFREYTGGRKTNEPEFIHNLTKPELYNVDHDPGENYNVAEKFETVISEMKKIFDEHEQSFVASENQLDKIDLEIWEERKILYQ